MKYFLFNFHPLNLWKNAQKIIFPTTATFATTTRIQDLNKKKDPETNSMVKNNKLVTVDKLT